MIMPRLRINRFTVTLFGCGLLGGVGLVIGQVQSVIDTPHNLSTSGPGNASRNSSRSTCASATASFRRSISSVACVMVARISASPC